MTKPKKNSIISGSITFVVMGLIILACALMGLYPPDPPIEEEGVEVNLGNSDFGSGNNPIPNVSENNSPNYSRPATSNEVATQNTEESMAMNASTTPGNTVTQEDEVKDVPEIPKKPEINKNALFKKKRTETNTNGGSQGITSGNGNQGKVGGDPNSNRYDGNPGKGGAGWSLEGRNVRALPTPEYNSNQQGRIVVKIWVDRSGNVIKAEAPAKGSTIVSGVMVKQAMTAAKRAKFSASSNAIEAQIGYITYEFRI